MSQQLISRSDDLRRLQDEGYEVEVIGGLLLIHSVPFVTESRAISLGTLASELTMAGDVTSRPSDHTVRFSGGIPCNAAGEPLNNIINSRSGPALPDGTPAACTFSSKPKDGYSDYHHKMTTYIDLVCRHIAEIDPLVTARTYRVVAIAAADTPFRYLDTHSGRAEIGELNARFSRQKVAIIGLGGSGSYILDFVAKSHVSEIHLFDGDEFFQHNAFRAPGAATVEQLTNVPNKADHFAAIYSGMRAGVISHPYFVDSERVSELDDMDFVFVAVDSNDARRLVVGHLQEVSVPFVDVGMGLILTESGLTGSLRMTASGADPRSIPTDGGDQANEYSTNIQITELNAILAAMAVVHWKKRFGFYADFEHERHSVYQIDGNEILNEGSAETDPA